MNDFEIFKLGNSVKFIRYEGEVTADAKNLIFRWLQDWTRNVVVNQRFICIKPTVQGGQIAARGHLGVKSFFK